MRVRRTFHVVFSAVALSLSFCPVPGASQVADTTQIGLALRPVFGREFISSELGRELNGHWRGELTVYLGAHQGTRLRFGGGYGWVSYGLKGLSERDRFWNSARAHLLVNFPVSLARGIRFYIEPRVTHVRLRPEKSEETPAQKSEDTSVESEAPIPLPEKRGWGTELVLGFEGPLPRGWAEGFHWSVSVQYGRFGIGGEPVSIPGWTAGVNTGRTGGLYVGVYWDP